MSGSERPTRRCTVVSEHRELAEAAAALAVRGYAVVPVHGVRDGCCDCGLAECPAPGKHPRVRWEKYQQALPEVAQVARWWRRWPRANVGVVTGSVSGLLVVDVDPRQGGDDSLGHLEARWGSLPTTVEVDTGGGGRHLWFRIEVDVPSRPIAPGLDLKGGGGLVVVPPSMHVSGQRYRWKPGRGPDVREPSPTPDWLLAIARGSGRPRPSGAPRPGAPVRTEHEQQEFESTWARVGVHLRAGDHNYLCPFHDDHHPSLHVDAEGCRWHCFGCGRGGGIGALRRELGDHTPVRPAPRLTHLPYADDQPVTLQGTSLLDVAGESRYQDELLTLTGGVRHYGGVDARAIATLGPDPEAPLDPQAVAVQICGRPVGYLRRGDAARLGDVIRSAIAADGRATCRARIVGGWDRGHGDVGAFGVRLELPPPDPVVATRPTALEREEHGG